MTEHICFIDKKGTVTLCKGTLRITQGGTKIDRNLIDCSCCAFKTQYAGIEREEFSYTSWTGYLKEVKE